MNKLKDKKIKNENLIFILILLVILLVSMNYIFNNDKKENEKNTIVENTTIIEDSLEKRIENTLSEINGISDVSVVINYTDNGRKDIIYDTKESYTEDGNVTSVEKTVAYDEESGKKNAIVKASNSPTVEGVLIVASGVENNGMKQKIATAIGNLLGIASYKVQVFEK